ncbi:MAG TPA: DUF3362 domain-containing protein, partial [Methylophilaceae bacterium]|nr:DUF3362 domain-containing protein [Methylophilaceae bacterium]
PKAGGVRRLHKAFIRYHDPNNWPMLREALKKMGRADLIGNGKKHLVPAWQPITAKPVVPALRNDFKPRKNEAMQKRTSRVPR